jgi:hypothetical protein
MQRGIDDMTDGSSFLKHATQLCLVKLDQRGFRVDRDAETSHNHHTATSNLKAWHFVDELLLPTFAACNAALYMWEW